jgi:hypothetical protein
VSIFSTGNNGGFGTYSNPGVPPVVQSITPDDGPLISGYPGSWIVKFDQCVPAQSLAANLTIKAEDIFGIEQLLPATVTPNPLDERQHTITTTVPLPGLTEVTVKIEAGMLDCDSDAKKNNSKFEYTVI